MEELFEIPKDCSIVDELIRSYLNNRTIVINDVIDQFILENATLHILEFNRQDKNIPKEKRKPIWVYIQSPGGSVMSGLNLIDIIKSSETPVYTVCFSNCSSMAFHLFISGHKRYAFKNSILLNHDGEVNVNNSSSKARDTMEFFNSLEDRIKNHVLGCTNITSDFYDSIYEKEYYMYADEKGKELGCVDYIIGEDAELGDIL